MAKDWQLLELQEVSKVVDSLHRTPAFTNSGYPMVRAADVKGGFLDLTETELVSEEEFLDFTRNHKPQHGDIVLSRVGSYFNFSYNMHKRDFCIGQNTSIIVPDIDSRFLYYSLISPFVQDQVERSLVGTSQRTLSLKYIRELKIPTPPLPEQRAIVGILGALDDKIEVNRRMNGTLESMARAVFREMMKDVEEQGSILEFANLLSGGTPKTAERSYWNGNIEWVSAKDVSNANGIFLLDTEKKISQEGIDNSATKLLPAKTVIVTARGTVGANCMLGKPMTMNQTNYGLKAKDGVGDYFIYFTLSEMVEQLKQQSYGTIFDTITTKTFQSALCAQPSIDVIQKFEGQVAPLIDAILNNQKEARTLGSLRDSLLPKLMRGEVRVKL